MYDDGFHNIFNIDISENVVSFMSKRSESRTDMIYEVMDVRDIKYPAEYFDFEIDKSTIDALLCGDKSFCNVALMLNEVQRTLKTGGYYIAISYGQPENRVFHFVWY